ALPCTGIAYQWSNGETTPTIGIRGQGTYTVTVTYPSGFVATSYPMYVFNKPKPSVSLGTDTVLCVNDSVILDAGSGFDFYQWQDSSTNQDFSITSSIPD